MKSSWLFTSEPGFSGEIRFTAVSNAEPHGAFQGHLSLQILFLSPRLIQNRGADRSHVSDRPKGHLIPQAAAFIPTNAFQTCLLSLTVWKEPFFPDVHTQPYYSFTFTVSHANVTQVFNGAQWLYLHSRSGTRTQSICQPGSLLSYSIFHASIIPNKLDLS